MFMTKPSMQVRRKVRNFARPGSKSLKKSFSKARRKNPCVRSAASSGDACHLRRTYLKTGFQYALASASNADRRTSARSLRMAATIEWRVPGNELIEEAIVTRLLQSVPNAIPVCPHALRPRTTSRRRHCWSDRDGGLDRVASGDPALGVAAGVRGRGVPQIT